MFGTLLGHKRGGFPSQWVEPPFLMVFKFIQNQTILQIVL
jgi:hypothetical protein